MEKVTREYVQYRDEGYWVAGTRVSLDSVAYSFLRGDSPESIAQSFPLLSLEEVYGAIAFYLAHRAEVDAYLQQNEREFDALRKKTREDNPALVRKLEEARQRLLAPRS
jgi:uncharacterized protein (DUF433 family)